MVAPAQTIVQPAGALVCPCGVSDLARIYLVDGRPLCGRCLDRVHNAEPRLISETSYRLIKEWDLQ